jgi:hypothetical protein
MQCIILYRSICRSPHCEYTRSPGHQVVLSWPFWGFGITSVLIAPFMPESVPSISHPTSLTFEQVSMVACQQGKRRGRRQSIVSLRPFGAFHRKALGYNKGHRCSCSRRDGGLLILGVFPRHKPKADHNYDHAFDDSGHVRCRLHLIIRHVLL